MLYLVFAGDFYYPLGGIDDLKASLKNKDEALLTVEEHYGSFDWCHVYDCQEQKIIWEKSL